MSFPLPLACAALVAGLTLAACGPARDAESGATAAAPARETTATVTGAGASFPAPLYSKWAADFHAATGQRINYQSVGSSAGVKQADAGTVDFGASDAPLPDEELARKGLVQFPLVIGGVIPVVNLQGVRPGQLRLDGQVLGDIYLGKVKRWNDPALVALNPGLPLPDVAIAPVRRADGSGTSFLFTSYLSKVNAEWKSKVGEGTAVNWPTGTGGKGNEGVAAFVGRLPGAIGYVEYAYVKQNRMNYALLRNADGQFVAPDAAAFQAAAASADWKRSFHQVLTQQPGPRSWPITGATFILMHRVQERPGQALVALRFFDWALTGGDATAAGLDYLPMPPAVKEQVRKVWAEQIRDRDGAPLPLG